MIKKSEMIMILVDMICLIDLYNDKIYMNNFILLKYHSLIS